MVGFLQLSITGVEHVPNLLKLYRDTFMKRKGFDRYHCPVFLACDAMAIEPYMAKHFKTIQKSPKLLAMYQQFIAAFKEQRDADAIAAQTDPERAAETDGPDASNYFSEGDDDPTFNISEGEYDIDVDAFPMPLPPAPESTQCTYFFVYMMQPLNPKLPSIPLFVLPAANGKANADTNHVMEGLAALCAQEGFPVHGLAADGDNAYNSYIESVFNIINRYPEATYLDLVQRIPIETRAFCTDFLHFLKCWRNKLANHPILLRQGPPPLTAKRVSEVLGLKTALNVRTGGAQLKDSVALAVFTLKNLTILLFNEEYEAALYFLPAVCWRVAQQAINLSRNGRLKMLEIAFECVRLHLSLFGRPDSPPQIAGIESPVFAYRKEDVSKLLCSLVSIGIGLSATYPPATVEPAVLKEVGMTRLGTSGLEHLFGMTRLSTRGNNHPHVLIRKLVKNSMKQTYLENFGLGMTHTNGTNMAGTICDLARPDVEQVDCDNTVAVIRALLNTAFRRQEGVDGTEEDLAIIRSFAGEIARLNGALIDKMKDDENEQALSGLSIMARIKTVEAAQAREHVVAKRGAYWTPKKLAKLKGYYENGLQPAQICEVMRITEADLLRGREKLEVMYCIPG
jgi:hypothetical protein